MVPISSKEMFLMKIKGWGCWFRLSRAWKNGLDVVKTTLWDSTCWPSSQTRVTSVKSLSSLRLSKAALLFSLNRQISLGPCWTSLCCIACNVTESLTLTKGGTGGSRNYRYLMCDFQVQRCDCSETVMLLPTDIWTTKNWSGDSGCWGRSREASSLKRCLEGMVRLAHSLPWEKVRIQHIADSLTLHTGNNSLDLLLWADKT